MLKPYDNQADIPDEFKEHYSKREDGKWHADIPNDHPAVKHNATLLSEKQTAEEKARTAEAALESAKASGLPRGHVAVPKADADLLEKVRAHGTAEEITAKLDEHKTLSERVATQDRKARLDGIRKAFEWKEDAVSVLELIQDFPETEDREIERGGKKVKVPHAKVKNGEEVTFKPFDEYFAEKHPALMPSVVATTTTPSTKVFGSAPGSNAAPGNNEFDELRNEIKGSQSAAQPKDSASVLAALGGQRLAATT